MKSRFNWSFENSSICTLEGCGGLEETGVLVVVVNHVRIRLGGSPLGYLS